MQSSKNIIILVLIIALGITSAYAGVLQKQPSPNIVIIIADDIGYGDFGCYGNRFVKTPNINRIAKDGMTFSNVYLTTSSCSPSRSSIISGRYPHNTGAAELHTPLPAGMVLFPRLLKDAGYYIASSGKWHLGENARKDFDVVNDKGNEIGEGGENMWLPTLKERPKNKPFFLWLAAIDAHRPWRTNEFDGANPTEQIVPPPYLANTETTKEDIGRYYDEITRFDHHIGLVEKELQLQGVLDNTIILIMSDNGAAYPRAKTRVYDSGMKTPLIIKWNKSYIKKGSTSNSLISAVDIAPTMVELAGVKGSATFQGKSFIPVLKNPGTSFRNYAFSEHNWHDYEAMERMVRSRDFLYVLNLRPMLSNQGPADAASSVPFNDLKALKDSGKLTAAQADIFMMPRPMEELYDCRTDQMQLINLASSPQHQQEIGRLRKVLVQWKEETADTYPDTITKDWFNRENGQSLPPPAVRGEMPGGKKAISHTGTGPF